MIISNITDRTSPKPIGIGDFVVLPGQTIEVPDEIAYVDELDRSKNKTGRKNILPAIVLLAGLNQIEFRETEKAPVKKEEPVEEAVKEAEEPVEETVEEKPKQKRSRKKAE